jgi:hypothetical protein
MERGKTPPLVDIHVPVHHDILYEKKKTEIYSFSLILETSQLGYL